MGKRFFDLPGQIDKTMATDPRKNGRRWSIVQVELGKAADKSNITEVDARGSHAGRVQRRRAFVPQLESGRCRKELAASSRSEI